MIWPCLAHASGYNRFHQTGFETPCCRTSKPQRAVKTGVAVQSPEHSKEKLMVAQV